MGEIRNPDDADNAGRDHHPFAFTLWLAGGGIKGGQVIGKTDDLGSTSPRTRSTSTICRPPSCTASDSTTPG